MAEAIAIILDVCAAMDQAPPGHETPLNTALHNITMLVQRKMFAESKDEIAFVLMGTDDTDNHMADGDCYENITIARPLGSPDWQLLEMLQNDIQASSSEADFIDAIVVALDHLVQSAKGKKGISGKRLVLFSNVTSQFADDKIDNIINGVKGTGVELNVIGPNLEDDEDGEHGAGDGGASNSHSKPKTAQQKAGEAMLKHILEEVDGECYSFEEALQALSHFQTKSVKQVAWKCQLEITDDFKLPICGYTRVTKAKLKQMKNVYAKDPGAKINVERTYHLNDEAETEVELGDTVNGHRYGNALIPFSAEDLENMKFSSEKCFKVLGFTKAESIKKHHFLGNSVLAFVADKGDEVSGVSLSALIHALFETNMVAIVRRVYRANSAPKIACLTPHIKANYECLFYTELPFSEDLRQFTFNPLPVGDNIPQQVQKLKPSEGQLAAVDSLISDMDLSQAVIDDEGNKEEALKPKNCFNPHIQRLYQCIQHRALNPDDPLPELLDQVARSLCAPKEVVTKCSQSVEKVKSAFKLEVVEKKKEDATGESVFGDRNGESGPPAKKARMDNGTNDNDMANLTKAAVTEVGTVSPVEDFKQLLARKDRDMFNDACKMMKKTTLQIIMSSFGNANYKKAMGCLKVVREEAIKSKEPKVFNDFLKEIKTLKGNQKAFFDEVIKENMSLIDSSECSESSVGKDEAKQFLKKEAPKVEEVKTNDESADADDLLDMM